MPATIYVNRFRDAAPCGATVAVLALVRAGRVSLKSPIAARYLRDWSDDDGGFVPPVPAPPIQPHA